MDKMIINDQQYGELLPFVKDEKITDINWNGNELWIDNIETGRYCSDVKLSPEFVNQFSAHVANVKSASFNKYNPKLEADSEGLRISIIHESCTETGTTISLRKSPPKMQMNDKLMVDTGYCSQKVLNLLKNLIKCHANLVMIGLTGSGKTELLKYLTGQIPDYERAITIEDTPEIHYREINPGKDCVALIVEEDSEIFNYTDAIKASLRQLPVWLLLSEARGTEVQYLIQSLTTGHYCLTTLHTDDVRKVPSRMKNMVEDQHAAERIENDIYTFLDVGVLIRKVVINGKTKRYIDQIGVYDRNSNDEKKVLMIVKNGKIVEGVEKDIKAFGETLGEKFDHENIKNPFALK